MKSSDLLLLTSQWEGMPNVVLEAMAAGIPVVTFDVEGAAELLGPVAKQQLVTMNTDEQPAIQRLSRCVVAIAHNQELRRQLGQSNRRRAAEFSVDKMVIRYQEIYDQFVNEAALDSSPR